MANKKNTGRRGATEVTRNLLNLASSLSDPGDYVSEAAIEKRLGCSPAQASKLYALLGDVAGDPSGILAYEDEDGLAVGTRGARGRALRLDADETLALLSALQRLGIPADHPMRAKLQGVLAGSGVDQTLIDRMLTLAPSTGDAATLSTCSASIAALRDLIFEYHKADQAPELRRVRPERLSQEDGAWYLHGLDLNKGAARIFRLDRMSGVESMAREDAGCAGGTVATDVRRVELVFLERRFLDLFQWPGLEVTSDGEEVVGSLPYYGGIWLPRQIAGCGGKVVARDPEVAELVRMYAADQLSGAQ